MYAHIHTQGKGQIFTTDLALAVLMAAPRSVASWDIVVQRTGVAMFLDVREGSAAYDNHVNETAQVQFLKSQHPESAIVLISVLKPRLARVWGAQNRSFRHKFPSACRSPSHGWFCCDRTRRARVYSMD